ncbi:TfoX/Sxy family protein [Variovorax sp. VNK109]|uniref:TfoX/Sxy family protein n=1 Tax=Variovorax sp. VNK109 TaxID=3400919 RepID=UPI003BFBABD4
MFGGWGISTGGLTFAIIAWETLYLKVEPGTEAPWVAAGCKPFVYEAKGRTMQMGYYTAPDSAMESREQMVPWARLALEAALKVKARAPAPRASREPRGSKPASGKRTSAPIRRTTAPAPKTSASRKSAKG